MVLVLAGTIERQRGVVVVQQRPELLDQAGDATADVPPAASVPRAPQLRRCERRYPARRLSSALRLVQRDPAAA